MSLLTTVPNRDVALLPPNLNTDVTQQQRAERRALERVRLQRNKQPHSPSGAKKHANAFNSIQTSARNAGRAM